MNNKKIFAIAALAIIAIVAVGSVSAFDLNFFGGDDKQTTTLGGIEFNIPEGYEIVDNYTIVNETLHDGDDEYIVNSQYYENDDGDSLELYTSDYQDDMEDYILKILTKGDEKTINGRKGYINSEDGFTMFSFVDDGNLGFVTVSDESILEEVVK
ncbi:hypothetical protein mru_1199 [Methanobrevibacter ruminantium M1]|uniref:Uncharacterized protein n=1 Tax=Methanobrevibacter ruminantium (strain ATCC 35063 / DSM 1093 / JCM 13430 / OCM 146 / M1) TaxID=634498 RepID=D3E3D8_METRM|nr:hypothetical protein [Methanobrevibacter ruminantium]ADC47049.1 hypothetical protein mru_1199 [Methanobrevibacter ruminantium M1]